MNRTNLRILKEESGRVRVFLGDTEVTGVLALTYPVFLEGAPVVGKEAVVLTLHRPEVVVEHAHTVTVTVTTKDDLH